MEIYKGVLSVLGLIVLVLIAVAVFIAAVSALLAVLEKRRELIYRREYERALVEIGRRLHCGAHWFSESEAAYVAIRVLGERLMHGHGADPSKYRDAWRDAMKKEPKPEIRHG